MNTWYTRHDSIVQLMRADPAFRRRVENAMTTNDRIAAIRDAATRAPALFDLAHLDQDPQQLELAQ